MTERPQLANIFAAHDDDPALLADLEQRLRNIGAFADVWRTASGWVVAWAPMPGTTPDGAAARAAGLVFVEGRDILLPQNSGDVQQRLDSILSLTDERPEKLSALPGDFGFIRFRPDGGLNVVSSGAGLAPFYWFESSGRRAISTQLGSFPRFLPDKFTLDPLMNAFWISGGIGSINRRTFLRGVQLIEHGHYFNYTPGQSATYQRYWDPRRKIAARPTKQSIAEHQEQLRELVLRRLQRDLDPAGGNLLTLSGGVDSSALAALIGGQLRLPLAAWSMLPEPEGLFTDEMVYIQPLLEDFAIKPHIIERLTINTADELVAGSPPVFFHVPHPALRALPNVIKQTDIKVLVGGEFADSLFGGLATTFDWLQHTSPLAFAGAMLTRPDQWRMVRDWLHTIALRLRGQKSVGKVNQLRDYIRMEVRQEYADWYNPQHRRNAADFGYDVLWQAIQQDGWVAMNWEVSSAFNVRRSLPFYNRELIELAFALHPSEWGFPGDKKIERAALRGLVPELNLNRPNKGFWGSYLRGTTVAWDIKLPAELAPVVQEQWFPQPPAQLSFTDAGPLARLIAVSRELKRQKK